MRPLGSHNYFVYITTNYNRSVLYIGMTNDLNRRLFEHQQAGYTSKKSFTGKYAANFLIYWEKFEYVEHAIEREKELKGSRRSKKERLIASFNPIWKFLNNEI